VPSAFEAPFRSRFVGTDPFGETLEQSTSPTEYVVHRRLHLGGAFLLGEWSNDERLVHERHVHFISHTEAHQSEKILGKDKRGGVSAGRDSAAHGTYIVRTKWAASNMADRDALIFLTKAEVLELQERSIQEFGGSAGIRDEGAFESALVAVENRVWYEAADLVACAATYAYHLAMAHAFVDGNKRVAAAATETFLVANEARLEASDEDLYDLFMAIAAGAFDRQQVEAWLRRPVRFP
jgi:death on curing protein